MVVELRRRRMLAGVGATLAGLMVPGRAMAEAIPAQKHESPGPLSLGGMEEGLWPEAVEFLGKVGRWIPADWRISAVLVREGGVAFRGKESGGGLPEIDPYWVARRLEVNFGRRSPTGMVEEPSLIEFHATCEASDRRRLVGQFVFVAGPVRESLRQWQTADPGSYRVNRTSLPSFAATDGHLARQPPSRSI